MRLHIYDVSGRRVTTLVDDVMEPGWYNAIWDGRDSRGRRVGSGIYFCRLEVGGSVDAKKVVLLK